MTKLAVIGLDCAAPELIFEAWRDELPHLRGLMERGVHGRLTSTVPPITVPAWMSMMTSQDPGQLGIYGFRNRRDYSYDGLSIASANDVKAKTVWNHLSRGRLRSLLLGVPLTYPPRPLNGAMVSCFMTPDRSVEFTWPPEFKAELDRAAGGEYIIDAKEFRTEDREPLLREIQLMTERRFRAFRGLLQGDDYDFAMVVEMGPDRLHHAFWRFHDPAHRLYEAGHRYERVIHDYYVQLDGEIGRTLDSIEADTSVMVVSDHGAQAMAGAICINEWLRREGYLTLKAEPDGPGRLRREAIDWERTTVWGEGGYYSRIFLNVAGREPQGQVPPERCEALLDELRDKLEAMPDEAGRPLGTRAYKPRELYRECRGVAPDLIVCFGGMRWRAADSVGMDSIYLYENDTGPDDANHAQDGVFIWRPPVGVEARRVEKYSIYDVAPTILKAFGIEPPPEMIGRSIM